MPLLCLSLKYYFCDSGCRRNTATVFTPRITVHTRSFVFIKQYVKNAPICKESLIAWLQIKYEKHFQLCSVTADSTRLQVGVLAFKSLGKNIVSFTLLSSGVFQFYVRYGSFLFFFTLAAIFSFILEHVAIRLKSWMLHYSLFLKLRNSIIYYFTRALLKSRYYNTTEKGKLRVIDKCSLNFRSK